MPLAFGRRFDGAITHFRDIDLLRRRRFVYEFPVARHPGYARRRGYFDGLTEFTALRTVDDAEDADSELGDGYVEPPLLYCDAGTALWRRMVEAGELSGADAVPPRPVALADAVLAVAEAADRGGDVRLIALWYTLGCDILVGGRVTEGVAGQVGRLREIVARTGAMPVPLPPADEQVLAMDDERETWWYLTVS
ncbi:hypothetical protein [Dactylosporangium sp. NPDC000521]|uniref:hypothetical protein n=1 Tax=Dactylosporangium sp. NPDC000521 TaxID=3363975 RepID=UPI00369F3843